jgi:mycothiol synthase
VGPEYEVRAPTPDDVEAVAAVFRAHDLDDSGESVIDADFLRVEWSRPGFDLATNSWIVVDGAPAIVGYAHAMLEEPDIVESYGVVHPERRGQGIGTFLLNRIQERATELSGGDPFIFRHAINADDRAAAAMLAARRLQVVRHFWHMQIDFDGTVDPGRAPEGITLAPIVAPHDLPDVHAIITASFVGHWGETPQPFDRWIEEEAGDDYDPGLWLLARDGERSVGALTASLAGDRGWVGYLGILPSHRGRGIGGALLRHSFAALAGRGARRVLLNVDADNETGATALYERVGMRVVKRWDMWERSSQRREQ